MEIVFNEAFIQQEFNSQYSEFGQYLGRRSNKVVDTARVKVNDIMHRVPTNVGQAIEAIYDPQLNGFVVGIKNEGRITEYLADKAQHPREGNESWLKVAMRDEFAA